MMIQQVIKGRTMTDVTMLDAGNYTDDEVIAAAMQAAGETPARLFGWSVKRFDEGSCIVTLNTD